MRALVVGSGWGKHAALALKDDPRTELRGIVGRGSERTAALAQIHSVPAFSDLEAAIAQTAPQVAVVSVHESASAAIVERLLGAGCHVLCSHPVAHEPSTVETLRLLAEEKSLRVGTDYTLRLSDAFLQLHALVNPARPPLRVNMLCPGRAMVIAVDMAAAIAGPVRQVMACGAYPAALSARVAASPTSFPPSVMLEHISGCVTSVVPAPHMDPASAHRVTVSTEDGRYDLCLPCGTLDVMRNEGRGRLVFRTIVDGDLSVEGSVLFGQGMTNLVRHFVDSISAGVPHPSFDEEVHVRAVWLALWKAARERTPIQI